MALAWGRQGTNLDFGDGELHMRSSISSVFCLCHKTKVF